LYIFKALHKNFDEISANYGMPEIWNESVIGFQIVFDFNEF